MKYENKKQAISFAEWFGSSEPAGANGFRVASLHIVILACSIAAGVVVHNTLGLGDWKLLILFWHAGMYGLHKMNLKRNFLTPQLDLVAGVFLAGIAIGFMLASSCTPYGASIFTWVHLVLACFVPEAFFDLKKSMSISDPDNESWKLKSFQGLAISLLAASFSFLSHGIVELVTWGIVASK